MQLFHRAFFWGILLGIWFLWGGFAQAEPITMQVTGADVRAVLMSAARLGGLNLVLGDEVHGQVTLSLTAEPEEILRTVAAVQGLVLVQENGVFLVCAGDRAAGLRQMHIYRIHYAAPEDLVAAVKMSLPGAGNQESSSNNKSSSGNGTQDGDASGEDIQSRSPSWVSSDAATGSLLLYGTAAEASETEAILRELDVPALQVSLEAKVVALSKDASKDLGVEWTWSGIPQYPRVERNWRSGRNGAEGRYDYRVERSFNGSEQMPGIIQFGHGPEGVPFEFYYDAKINALVSDGKAKILARPNITTIQGREAVINIGGEVPVPTQSVTNSTSTTSLEYKKAGIILKYTPRVNADGCITATVHTEVSSPVYVQDIKAYRFQNRSADTQVRLRDGETMVIGGLIGSEESRTLSKVPFLGDLPVLGAFFRNLKTNKSESEIMIFLTAHVLREDGNQSFGGEREQEDGN